MDEASVTQYILDTFDGVETVTSSGNTFFFYGSDRKFPFVTLVTNDEYDQFSNLNRPSVFRLNIGISKQTFRSFFGAETSSADGEADKRSSRVTPKTFVASTPRPCSSTSEGFHTETSGVGIADARTFRVRREFGRDAR